MNPEATITLAMVGKYMQVKDSYISLTESLQHAGVKTRTRVNVRYIDATDIERDGTACLQGVDAVLVPGGFGERGIEGKIQTVRWARENKVPFLGICLGMQVACIEYARDVLGLEGANSTEFNRATPDPVIGLITEWQDAAGSTYQRSEKSDMGGTMRLGAQACRLGEGTLARATYGSAEVMERHRHRYEFNNTYLDRMAAAGLHFSGRSVDGLVEVVELPGHPWFLAVQFHPEFQSTPRDGHPLFTGFIRAARQFRAAAVDA